MKSIARINLRAHQRRPGLLGVVLAALLGTTCTLLQAETVSWLTDIPAGGWPTNSLGPHTTTPGQVCNGSRDFTAQITNATPVTLVTNTPRPTTFQDGLIYGMSSVPDGDGLQTTMTFTDSVENVSFSIYDVDGVAGAWQDRIIVQAFDGATPRAVDVSCGGGVGACPATIISNPPFGNNQIDAGTTATGFTSTAGQWDFTVAGPVTRIEMFYRNHTVPTSTTQFIALSQVTYDCSLIGVSKQMTNVNGAGQSPYDVTVDFEFENFGEVPLTNLTALEDLSTVFNNPVGPTGIGTFVGNYTFTSISLLSGPGTVSANGSFDGSTQQELFGPGSSLAPGETAVIRVSLQLDNYATYNNQVTVSGTTPEGDQVSDTSTDGTDPDGGDGDDLPDESVISVLDTSTLPVTLSYFEASTQDDQLRISWGTDVAFGNLGFELWVEDAQGRRLLTDLIPAQAGNQTGPGAYDLLLDGGAGEVFWISDLDVKDQRRFHGPFSLNQRHGRTTPPRSINWQAASAATDSSFAPAIQRKGPTANGALTVEVDQTGIQRITGQDLLNAGWDLNQVSSTNLALSVGGEPVPLRVDGTPLSASSTIDFYAEQVDSQYTRIRPYTLSENSALARRMTVETTVPVAGSGGQTYRANAVLNNQSVYDFSSPTDDPWRSDELLAINEQLSRDYNLTIDAVAAGGANAELSVVIHGGRDTTAPPDGPGNPAGCGAGVPVTPLGFPVEHCVQVAVNGAQVGELAFDGLVVARGTFPVPVLAAGTHTVTLTLPLDHGYNIDRVQLESLSLAYDRNLAATADGTALQFDASGVPESAPDPLFTAGFEVAADNLLAFATASSLNPLRADGFGSPDLVAFGLGAGGATWLSGTQVQDQGGEFSITLPRLSTTQQYWVSEASSLLRPRVAAARQTSSLDTGSAEYLMITHPAFAAGTGRLADIHRNRGLDVHIANVLDVYDTYSEGVVDPSAIQAYVQEMATQRSVNMVLLVGGDTYDYLDFLNAGSVSYIPTFYEATNEFVRFTPADALFVDLNNDRVPDLPLGRLPVRSTAELDLAIDKIERYLAGENAGMTSYFVADAADEGGDYGALMDQLVADLPQSWSVSQSSKDALGTGITDAVVDGISQGPRLTTFLGHSGPRTWFKEPSFDDSHISSLINNTLPSVVVQWGCWNGYFVDPVALTLADRFLFTGDQGAVAVLGASALSETSSETVFAEFLVEALKQPGITLGEAVQTAKLALANEPADYRDVVVGWLLLGDPALIPWNAN